MEMSYVHNSRLSIGLRACYRSVSVQEELSWKYFYGSECEHKKRVRKVSVRKIAIVGINKKDSVVLKAAIETASGFETGLWECTTQISEGQVIIVDPASPKGVLAIDSYADKEGGPLLVKCSADDEQKQQAFRYSIEQPINYKHVLTTLRQFDSLVKATTAQSKQTLSIKKETPAKEQQKINKPSENPESEILKPEKKLTKPSNAGDDQFSNYRLYHLIKEVIVENKSVEISHPDFPSIKICSEKHWFIFPEDLDQQSRLFKSNVDDFTIEDKGDEIRRQAFSGSFPKALWELVYTATLLGTDGELLNPLLAEDQLHLIELPEFKLAPHSEQHIAIADYMISHSATVKDVSNNLGIDQKTVIDFCNACQSIGLLIVSGEPRNRLFRLINKIVEQKKSVEITHPKFPNISICSEKDWFIFDKDLNKNTEIFCVEAGDFSFENRGDEIRREAFSGTFPKSLWELVYTATMFGTEGKLLKPLRATDRLSLIKKPEFEYVIHEAKHITLADYMTLYSDTIHDIAVNNGVELSDVIDFCNICQAINLIERNSAELTPFSEKKEEEVKDVTQEVQQPESKASKLIHSLLSKYK